jgi:transketolase
MAARFEAYKATYPDEADALVRMQRRQLPDGWEHAFPNFPADTKGLAGRDASAKVLNAVAQHIPWLIGGSADLAPSTKTRSRLTALEISKPVRIAAATFISASASMRWVRC